jgi:hypothetical protein
MNKTFIKLFFLMPMALFLMSLTSSCSRFSHRNILSCDSLKYDSTATVNKIKIQCHLLVDYPTSGNKYLLQNIKEWINENVETPYLDKLSDGNRLIHFYGKCITDTLIAEARSFNSEAPELFRDITIRKAYETKKYVTYIINYSSYDGGAHGSSSVSGATFRKSDGRKFGMDMFTLGGYYEIKDLIKEGLKGYFICRGSQIRTDDFLLPKQARYRTALCPEYFLLKASAKVKLFSVNLPNIFWLFLFQFSNVVILCNEKHSQKEKMMFILVVKKEYLIFARTINFHTFYYYEFCIQF